MSKHARFALLRLNVCKSTATNRISWPSQYLHEGGTRKTRVSNCRVRYRAPSISELTSALSYLKGNSRATD